MQITDKAFLEPSLFTVMKTYLTALFLITGLSFTTLASSQTAPLVESASPDHVTVIMQVTLRPGVKAEDAINEMGALRAAVKKQPGFISENLLQNYNRANSPALVYVTRWASMRFWEGVFTLPEYKQLNAEKGEKFKVYANAFRSIE